MPLLSNDLRGAVLQAGIEGKLTSRESTDSDVKKLVDLFTQNKMKLINEKKIRKEKVLPPIGPADIPFDIPESWCWVRLSDICNITDGTHQTPQYTTTGRPFLSAQNIKPFRFNPKVFAYVSEEDFQEYNKFVAPEKGDILMTRVGAGIGEAAINTADYEFSIYVSLTLIKPYIKNYDLKYVLYVLNSPYGRDYAEKKTLGKKASQGNYNLGFIREFILPFPPLEEQSRIGKRFEKILPKLDIYEESEQKLHQLEKRFPIDIRNSILAEAFEGRLSKQLGTDTPTENLLQEIGRRHKKKIIPVIEEDETYPIPDSWARVRITDVVDLYTGNSIPEAIKAEKYLGLSEGYPYIGTKDVGFDHTVDYENGVRIPFNEPKFKYAYPDATLLCIEGGSAGKKIAIIDSKVCFGNKLCAFHPIGIDKEYLYYYLQSPEFFNSFTDKISGLIGGVSINKIKQLTIPVPPIEEQKRIVARLEELLPLCERLK